MRLIVTEDHTESAVSYLKSLRSLRLQQEISHRHSTKATLHWHKIFNIHNLKKRLILAHVSVHSQQTLGHKAMVEGSG